MRSDLNRERIWVFVTALRDWELWDQAAGDDDRFLSKPDPSDPIDLFRPKRWQISFLHKTLPPEVFDVTSVDSPIWEQTSSHVCSELKWRGAELDKRSLLIFGINMLEWGADVDIVRTQCLLWYIFWELLRWGVARAAGCGRDATRLRAAFAFVQAGKEAEDVFEAGAWEYRKRTYQYTALYRLQEVRVFIQ